MTKKKKSILSDQRFIVLLVIIVLFAIFSFKSREFRRVLFRSPALKGENCKQYNNNQ